MPPVASIKKSAAAASSNPIQKLLGSGAKKIEAKNMDKQDEARFLVGSRFEYEELNVRLNNLNVARRKFVDLLREVRSQYEEMKEVVFKGAKLQFEIEFDNLVSGTNTFMFTFVKDMCAFIGARNVFIELNSPLFENLYIPSVNSSNLQTMIDSYFEPMMESFFANIMDSACQDMVIKATCKNVCTALEVILLDGGDKRIFQPQDSAIILKDLRSLENFFYADGAGIQSKEFVTKCFVRLKAIAGGLMDKPSEALINGSNQNLSFAKLPIKSNDDNVNTKQIVYKVLYHRSDPAAKKFIKSTPYAFD